MIQNNKKVIGIGHLELKFRDLKESGVLQDHCIFMKDCCLSKDYCTVETAISCQTYKFMKKYGVEYQNNRR